MELGVVGLRSKHGGDEDGDRHHDDFRKEFDVEVVHSSRSLEALFAELYVVLSKESFVCYCAQSCWKALPLPFP